MITGLKFAAQFLFLLALQVLVLNNIQLFGYMNPYLYILLIFNLPVRINRNLLLLVAFSLGLCVDVFENSGAIHASATLLIAFLRPFLFNLMAGSNRTEIDSINIKTFGPVRYMVMVAILVFIHHFWLFALEAFKLSEILHIIQRTILSSVFTLLLIYLAQLLVYKKEK